MQAFGMRFLRLGSDRSRTAAGIREGKHGLTLCADGFRRLIIKKENNMATPYKECPLCGAHIDSGEKCDCRTAEADDNAEKELKERAKDNDRN